MSTIREKKVKGQSYYYEQESYREGGKVKTRHVKYLGKADSPQAAARKKELEVVNRVGGSPEKKHGGDGMDGNRPIETKYAMKDNRFRINKDNHEIMKRTGGYYVFQKKGRPPVKVKARDLDKIMGKGKWFKDRNYPHRFVTVNEVYSSPYAKPV